MIAAGKPLDLAQFAGCTPGPWVVSGGRLVMSGTAHTQSSIACVFRQDSSDEECGNALLIAAAPSLLAECQRQREVIAELRAMLGPIADGAVMDNKYPDRDFTLGDVVVEYQKIARAALAKSVGQS